jgi:hypothetical protein
MPEPALNQRPAAVRAPLWRFGGRSGHEAHERDPSDLEPQEP